MKKCKLLTEKQISKLNQNQVDELTNEHNQLYNQYVEANPNLEHVEFDANRYWNDTITKKQAEWLDTWLEKAEQLQDIHDELYRSSFLEFKFPETDKLKISKKMYSKLHTDYKSIINGKPYMMVLNPKTKGTELVPVKFEEVD